MQNKRGRQHDHFVGNNGRRMHKLMLARAEQLWLRLVVGNDDWYSLIPNDHLGIEDVRQIVNKENYWYGLQSIKIVATGES
jgi:hypothetical protein